MIAGVAPTHVQELAPHEVRTDPPLKPVQVPLDGILSLRFVDCTTQLGVVGKLAEGALSPTVHDTNKDGWFFFSVVLLHLNMKSVASV